MVFIGWGLAGLSFVVAIAGLSIPGAGKLISLAFFGWALLFLPPLWSKTIQYGLPVNIVFRVAALITLPLIFTSIAMANGYKGAEVSTVTMQPTASPSNTLASPISTVSPSPVKIVSPSPSINASKTNSPKPLIETATSSPISTSSSGVTAKEGLPVTLTTKGSPVGTNGLAINGETNLPEDFILTVRVCRYHFEKKDVQKHCLGINNINPSEQLVPVKNGKFSVRFTVPTIDELRNALTALEDGLGEPGLGQSPIDNYISIDISGDPRKQSEKIMDLLGKKGEQLKGDLVENWTDVKAVSIEIKTNM
jgi:hypothetical protein